MSIFTRTSVQPVAHEQIRTEPVDVIVRAGQDTEVIRNVTRIWVSADSDRQTFLSDGKAVRTSIVPGGQRRHGQDYPYRPVMGLVHRATGKYITVEEAQQM